MGTIVRNHDLQERALRALLTAFEERPGCKLSDLLDEIGARFNLSPLDREALEHLFSEHR